MKAIIPVAGEGRRMRPHTHSKPKPIFPLAGRPGISYLLDDLNKLGVTEVIFITGHLKEKFEAYIRANYSFNVRFIEQKKLDGTAGAVRLAEEFIDEPVLIAFADAVFDADISIVKLLKAHESGIIWVQEVEDYQRFGVCVLDKHKYLERIVEKPSEPISKLANVGLYYVKDYKLLFKGIHHVFDTNKTLKGEYFLTDAFDYMISKGAKFICPTLEGWFDYGKPETALESNRHLLKRHATSGFDGINSKIIPPVFIAPGVVIENSIVGPFVSIQPGSVVRNSVVRDSIIGSDVKIEQMILEKSILSDSSELKGKFKSFSLGEHSEVND